MLGRAKESYIKAEKLLEDCDDEMAIAKLNFNYANTLRQIGPNNLDLLQEAKSRFQSAEKYFMVNNPRYLPNIKEALNSVDGLIAMAPVSTKFTTTLNELNEITSAINTGEDTQKTIEKIKEFKAKTGGIARQISDVYGLLNTLSDYTNDKKKLEDIKNQLDQIASQVSGPALQPGSEESKILDALRKRLHQDIGSGKVDEPGAKIIMDLIDRLGTSISSDSDTIQDILKRSQAIRDTFTSQFELTHYLSHGLPRPPKGSRAAILIELCWLLRRFLLQEMSKTGKGDEEKQKILELDIKGTQVDKHLYEAGNENDAATKFECNELRPYALEVRNLSARHYSMIARPIWSIADVAVDVKSVFFSGLPEHEKRISSLFSEFEYTFSDKPQGHSFSESRWRQLLSAVTAVFDFRSAKGSALAAITYEMGIALSIGKPIVIIVDENITLPFDIEIKPVVIRNNSDEDSLLPDAVEQSLYWTYPIPGGKPSLATINYVKNDLAISRANLYANQMVNLLNTDENNFDSLFTDNVLKKIIDYMNDGRTSLIHSAFPPEYPKTGVLRVFHVTPFGPSWAAETTKQIRKACKSKNAEYIRGDEAEDSNVIQSIWSEIAKASHIVADITDFNPNVALEIGIAHTLGRPTLLIGQRSVLNNLFPMIAKLRIIPYDKTEELGDIVKSFLPD